jgi:hypothetical protein
LKECKDLKAKLLQQWHKWRHNAYRVGQVGYYERKKKDFGNKNSNPTTMAQVEAQCLPYWPSMGVKNERQKEKS